MKEMRNRVRDEKNWQMFGGKLTLCLTLFGFAACESNRPKDPYVSVSDAGVTVENVMLNSDAYVGKQVTVAGTVKETFGEQAFMINGEKLVDELLAVGADPYPDVANDKFDYSLAPVKGVRVTGVVRRFNVAEIERETGVKLDAARLANYAGKPVIVVKAIEKAQT